MRVRATVDGADGEAQLEGLARWLRQEPELRGLVVLQRGAAPGGAMGPLADAVETALGSAGVGAALVSSVLAWLRHRTGDVRVTLTRTGAENRIEITASRLRKLDSTQVRALAADALNLLEAPPAPGGASNGVPDGLPADGDAGQ